MTWTQRATLLGRALLVPLFCLLAWLIVALAQASQQDPRVPARAPIASIAPTDPVAR
jgi:hypothetical protein